MTLEMCCQCDEPTGRAGRADDSLYTDNDWGPYCPDCWQDGDYWRCIADEKMTETFRLKKNIADALNGSEALVAALENAAMTLQDCAFIISDNGLVKTAEAVENQVSDIRAALAAHKGEAK